MPNVDSALVFFDRHASPLGDEALRKRVFAVIDGAFGQRRKTLRQALAEWAGSAANAEQILTKAGVSPQSRGEQLGIEEFIAIARANV